MKRHYKMTILWSRKTGIYFFFFSEIVDCVSINVDKILSAKTAEQDFWTIATASDIAYSIYLLRMYSDKNGEMDEWKSFLSNPRNQHRSSEDCTRTYDGDTVENDLTSGNSMPNTNNHADECDGKSSSRELTSHLPLKANYFCDRRSKKRKFVKLWWKI